MLAILLPAAALAADPPDFSQINTFGPVRIELPLTAAAGAAANRYLGTGGGIEFHLTIDRQATSGDLSAKAADDAGAKLKASPGMKSYRGGSVLPIKLGTGGGWLLRFNFGTQDNREVVIDELLVPVNGQVYDFEIQADRHDPKAMAWLSRCYNSLRADIKGLKDARLSSFTSDGLIWQNWRSAAIRLAMLVPHTPFVAPAPTSDAELTRREGDYADSRYSIHFDVAEMKADPTKSVADMLHSDLALFSISDAKITKPEGGKSRTVDSAPASMAECSVETPSGTSRLVLLDVLKERLLYRFVLSAPSNDPEATRNLDRMIDSIKLLPPVGH